MEVAGQTLCLTQSQYTDTGPTSPSADPISLSKQATKQTNPLFTARRAPRWFRGKTAGLESGRSGVQFPLSLWKFFSGSSHISDSKIGIAVATLSGCCLLVGCLTSQQQASVSQGRICSDNFICCHTEIEVAHQTFYLTQSQYTDTGPTSPSADPITPGAWQGSHWSANFKVTGMTGPRKNPGASGIRTRDLPLSRRTP